MKFNEMIMKQVLCRFPSRPVSLKIPPATPLHFTALKEERRLSALSCHFHFSGTQFFNISQRFMTHYENRVVIVLSWAV